MAERSLIRFAKDSEDVASGLTSFRDSLPRSAARITRTISELFAISSVLREIHNAEGDTQSASSFYRVQDDLNLLFPTLQWTLDAVFDMFARSRDRPHLAVWLELGTQMANEEGLGLLERLELYHDFLRAEAGLLKGDRMPSSFKDKRRRLIKLRDAQEEAVLRAQRRSVNASGLSRLSREGRNRKIAESFLGASTPRAQDNRPGSSRTETPEGSRTPRARKNRPRPLRMDTPLSPTSTVESWDEILDLKIPPSSTRDQPRRMPTSPTITSSSSQTLPSSQTSYSSDSFAPKESSLIHWAQDIFDGQNPTTQFKEEYQLDDRSICYGTPDVSSEERLTGDGFEQAIQLSFDMNQVYLRLYFRPSDSRARVLIMAKDENNRSLRYCTPLGNVKIIREASTLQLCRARGEGRYTIWARLNFVLYERMVLFYCTFVAMKRQDSRPVPHDALLDDFQLEDDDEGEVEEFGGTVKDHDLLHAVRLFRDCTSGVVRLEACALRGPMKNVPLWTAFLTRYAHDPDHVQFEGEGVVSFADIRPPPYVFLAGYEPPINSRGENVLQFTSDEDAREFVENWTRLCRMSIR